MQFLNIKFSEKMSRIATWALWVISLYIWVVLFVPFSPSMPLAGLDPSWQFAMNHAVSSGLSIGEDITFTFGPYASIYTKLYHPLTDFIMVSGSLYLALSTWIYFLFLMRGTHSYWILFFFALLNVFVSYDSLFFFLPLLVGLVSVKFIFSKKYELLLKSKLSPFFVIMLFAPLGLLPLIKGSMLGLTGVVVIICTIFFAVNKQRLFAVLCLSSTMISMFVFWLASGQSATGLLSYLINMLPIVSGYTEAMAINGNNLEVFVYLITSVFILWSIIIQKQYSNTSKLFYLWIYFVFLFVAFKAGFVRHDGHANIAGVALLLAAMSLPFVIKTRIIVPVVILSIASCCYINSHYAYFSFETVVNRIKCAHISAWQGIANRIINPHSLKYDFETTVDSLREKASLPILQGTADIYSYNQSYLIASGNIWSPRPTFQSFSAYTPKLVEANKNHLLGENAPDNIFFNVETIDERMPSLDDGASWPILLHKYVPAGIIGNNLLLRKKKNMSEVARKHTTGMLINEKHMLGEHVGLPDSTGLIFAKIEIEPTRVGRLASGLFKPSFLFITLEMINGTKTQYRIISGMAKSGFLISPLIENTAEFGMLYGDRLYLNNKRVKSIVITSADEEARHWKKEYTIRFNQIETALPINIKSLGLFDDFSAPLLSTKVETVKKCEGAIDSINNISPGIRKIQINHMVEISGWLVKAIDNDVLPEAVYIVLTDDEGKRFYLRTHPTNRPDVATYFNKPKLNRSGFRAFANIFDIKSGQYKLGLAIKDSDRLEICPQFNIPIKITI